MLLINNTKFKLEFFIPSSVSEYAVLLPTWGKDEITFREFQDLEKVKMTKRFSKIKMTCQPAWSNETDYV